MTCVSLGLFAIKYNLAFTIGALCLGLIFIYYSINMINKASVKNAKKVKELNNILSKNILYLWKKYLPKSKLVSMGASCAYSSFGKGFSYTKGKLFGGTKDFAMSKRILAK